MSSEQEVNFVAPSRVLNKLTLDSEEQERRQREERQIQQENKRRKQQKRKRRQQAERLQQQKIQQQLEKEKKYDQPQMMFEQDSDDGIEFKRVLKKIKRLYPKQLNNYQSESKQRGNFIVPDDEDEDEESSEQESDDDQNNQSQPESDHRKNKKQRKQEKKAQKKDKKPFEKKKVQVPVKKEKVKIQPINDRKQHLVKMLSIRWWYALPQWPPKDYDYKGKLKELGYRALPADRFRIQDEVVNGLQKVQPVDGYLGLYKSKTKLIDVRPKESAPTINNFRSKSIQELSGLLRKALNVQIQQLMNVKYKQKGQHELLSTLQRQLNKIKV